MTTQLKEATPARNRSYVHKDNLGSGMKQEYIENCLTGWVEEHKRLDSCIRLTKGVLAKEPKYLSEFGVALYEHMLEKANQEKSKCRRKIQWLGQLHDQATNSKRFSSVRSLEEKLDKEAIRERTDCRDLAEKYIEVRRRGKYAVGLCPFHEEKTPSFYAYQDGFKCFGCQWAGDCYKFVMEAEKVDFSTALQKVGQA